MGAFFFGPADRQLFGYHHSPRGSTTGAVLIAPSWGPEYQYAHRALRVLAKRLAERGFHVLRFDYSGVGDSWGDSTDGDLVRWQADFALACQELRDRSGQTRIDIVGLRLGSAVTCSADGVRRLVHWDPVTSGAAWVAAYGAPKAAPTQSEHVPPTYEFAQRLVTTALLEQLTGLGPERYQRVHADAVLWLDTQGGDSGPPAVIAADPRLQYLASPDVAPWHEDASIWSGQVPAKSIRAIVEWLTA